MVMQMMLMMTECLWTKNWAPYWTFLGGCSSRQLLLYPGQFDLDCCYFPLSIALRVFAWADLHSFIIYLQTWIATSSVVLRPARNSGCPLWCRSSENPFEPLRPFGSIVDSSHFYLEWYQQTALIWSSMNFACEHCFRWYSCAEQPLSYRCLLCYFARVGRF